MSNAASLIPNFIDFLSATEPANKNLFTKTLHPFTILIKVFKSSVNKHYV